MAVEVQTSLEVSWNIGDGGTADDKRYTEPESQRLPSITENGIRLGTPVAREAAKSFWSMDMLKTSLNRMAFYADCENHSQGSLGSPDSGFHSSRATPTLPLVATSSTASSSASSSPQSVTRHGRKTPVVDAADSDDDESPFLRAPHLRPVTESPLLLARLRREASTPTPQSGDPSTVSLTSSSKTISPSHSSQTLLPRRRVGRSQSADTLGREPQRIIKGACSDTCLKKTPSPVTKLRHRTKFILN